MLLVSVQLGHVIVVLDALQVDADFKAAAFTPDVMEQRRMQSETLSAVFQTYFRILKHTMELITARFVPLSYI